MASATLRTREKKNSAEQAHRCGGGRQRQTWAEFFPSAAIAYVVVSFALTAPWHFVLFKDLYQGFGLYNRVEPIIPLGVLSMLVQGSVLALIYPRWYRGGPPALEGVKFGLISGMFLFSVSTLANAAKIQVHGLGMFVIVQAAFHLLQFAVAGAAMGMIFGRVETKTG
jgi:hypothetical protein